MSLLLQRITQEPGKLGGKPCIRGIRISVSQVLAMLGDGLSTELILDEFPDLEPEDIQACLIYASQLTEAPRPRQKSA
ncbi:MAG: DUF433 domain-containing protein [Vulcanimicrobiota bacterium]